jgi:hypothetical protein
MGSSLTHAKFHKQHFLPTKILIKLSMCSQVLATIQRSSERRERLRGPAAAKDSRMIWSGMTIASVALSPRFELFASPHDAISTLTSYPPPSLSVHLRPLSRPGPYLHSLRSQSLSAPKMQSLFQKVEKSKLSSQIIELRVSSLTREKHSDAKKWNLP